MDFRVFEATSPRAKLAALPSALVHAREGRGETPPLFPGRDAQVVSIRDMPPKEGLSTVRGQARLLHDIANIELQAMELALRTCVEFSHEDPQFFEELAALTFNEGEHLAMCLDGLEQLGHPWGTWPVHLSLWCAVKSDDSILDRLLIVHRYQEGGGLDAGESLMRRLNGVQSPVVKPILERIFAEELGHVQFGSHWYKTFCARRELHSETDFKDRLGRLMHRMPRRLERVSHDLRKKAGFTETEIAAIEFYQKSVVQQNQKGPS